VIDEPDRRQIIDRTARDRSHSYGVLDGQHGPRRFFKAGSLATAIITARSRRSVPERARSLWRRATYLAMSLFLYGDHQTALLMYHNLADQNVGTDPINLMRPPDAPNGLRKTAALYLYPCEDHGPVAKRRSTWAR
jgi:hypothetical protein